jgi:hypothetical protein
MNCLLRNFLICWLWVAGAVAGMGTAQAQAQTQAAPPAAKKPARVAASLPAQDFLVSLRQVDAQQDGYSVGTEGQARLQAQSIRVSNGAQGVIRLNQATPMLWMSAVSSQNAQINASAPGQGGSAGPALNASSAGGAVSQNLVWMDAGQSLVFSPQWAGGQQAVRLEVAMAAQAVEARQGLDLPAQHSQQLSTTVWAPLGQWVTLSDSGEGPRPGVYGTNAAKAPRRWVQVRVSLQ